MDLERGGSDRTRRWWYLFGIALALLLVADLLTTLWATSVVGVRGEANPVMRSLLRQGAMATIGGHLIVGGVAIVAFARVASIARTLEPPWRARFATWCERWLLGLITLGAMIVCNNLLIVLRAGGW